jgi:ribosomal protein S21
MATNIQVEKTGNDNTGAVLRKFTQRMRSSGIVQKMRKIRYRSRPLSKSSRRKEALRKISRRDEFETLIKEGKLSDSVRGKRVKWGK